MFQFRLPASLFASASFLFLLICGCPDNYDAQPAYNFLFDQYPFQMNCKDRPSPLPPGTHTWMTFSPQAPYARTRLETLTVPRYEVPALTIAADPSHQLRIEGSAKNQWDISFCAIGEGITETEAREYMQQISMARTGALLTLNDSHQDGLTGGHGDLIVEAPANAPLTVHATYSSVQLRNMSGPVRITATQARASILNTTGKVDAEAFDIDFAGSQGNVILNAAAEINMKLTAARFQGTLSANAQRQVRALLPKGFQTSLEVLVNRRKDFVCRAEFCSAMKKSRKNGWYVFTYAGNGNSTSEHVGLESVASTVVLDTVR